MNVTLERNEQEREPTLAHGPVERHAWSVTITPRTLWLAVGLIALLAAITIVLLKALNVFILLFFAIVLAEGIRPLVNWLQSHRIPRPLAVIMIYLALLLILLGLGYLLVQPIVLQIGAFTTHLPTYEARIQAFSAHIHNDVGNNQPLAAALSAAQANIGSIFTNIAQILLQIPLLLGEVLFSVILIIVMAFFWLTGIERLKPFFIGLFPSDLQPVTTDVLDEMAHKIGGYLRGVVINMFVIGIFSGIADFFLGVPYPALLGILAGLTESIPYFGPWISGGAAAIVAIIAVGPLKGVEVIILYIIIQEFEGNLLVPYVMMRTVALNPLTVIIAVLLGTEMLGIIGGILAVPLAVVVQVLIMRVIGPVVHHASARSSTRQATIQPTAPHEP